MSEDTPRRSALDHNPVYLIRDPETDLVDGYYIRESTAKEVAPIWEKRLGRKVEIEKVMPGKRFYLLDYELLNHDPEIMGLNKTPLDQDGEGA